MGVSQFNIQSERYSRKAAPTCELSVLLGTDSFLYFVQGQGNELLAVHNHSDQLGGVRDEADFRARLQQIVLGDERLTASYKSIKVGLLGQPFALLPAKLFKAEQAASYLGHISDFDPARHRLLHEELPGLRLVYSLRKAWADALQSSFGQCRFVHAAQGLIRLGRKLAAYEDSHKLFASISGQHLQILLYDGQELVYCNHFACHSAKDYIYYLMLVYEQFRLSPETLPLNLAGRILRDSEVYHLFYRYVRHIHFLPHPDFLHSGDAFEGLPEHYYADLYSLKLCE